MNPINGTVKELRDGPDQNKCRIILNLRMTLVEEQKEIGIEEGKAVHTETDGEIHEHKEKSQRQA